MDGIFYILAADSFTFLPGLPRPSQKGKFWSQYELGVAFYRTLYGPFVLNNNLWAIWYFMIDFTCFLTKTRSPVSNYLTSLSLLRNSLRLSLLSDTRTLNKSICLNRSGDASSKWSKYFVLLKYPPLTLMVIGTLEMGTLCKYPLPIKQFHCCILGLNYKRTVQRIRHATIGEGHPCLLSVSSITCSNTNEILHF